MWFTFNENTVPFMIGNLNCFIHSFPFLILSGFYGACRLDKIFARKPRGQHKKDLKKNDDLNSEEDQDDLFVERIRLEKMDLRLCDVLLKKSLSLSLSLFHSHEQKFEKSETKWSVPGSVLHLFRIMSFFNLFTDLKIS